MRDCWIGSAYVSKRGSGAFDTITYASGMWTWTDGNDRATETFDNGNSGRIIARCDADGNQLSYSSTGTLLTRATTANGEYTDLTWSGNNLTQLVTRNAGGSILVSRVR